MSYKKIRISPTKTIDEHRKVMQDYIGRELKFNEVVHHKDGNKKNNNIENLQLMTRAEHSRMHFKPHPCSELTKKKLSFINLGEKNNRAKLKEADVLKIREMLALGLSGAYIGRVFKISKYTVGRIKKKETWKHVS